jgi:O-antigen/teichoic acid export membrane protein
MDLFETFGTIFIWIFCGVITLSSLLMFIMLFFKQRERINDPVYVLIMIITVLISVFAFMKEDFGQFTWLFCAFSIALVNLFLIAITKPGYDLEQGVKNGFKVAKKCPHCFSSLPSYFTSKCPHCTSEL